MFKRLLSLLAVACVAASVGCIANHKYGCDNTSLVAAGSPEGQVFIMHGAPDQIIEIGNPVGPNVHHWTKYLADAMHPKARVGYGGDFGYSGSYGQEGRVGGAIIGQNARDNASR
jgi:hypothetical protein